MAWHHGVLRKAGNREEIKSIIEQAENKYRESKKNGIRVPSKSPIERTLGVFCSEIIINHEIFIEKDGSINGGKLFGHLYEVLIKSQTFVRASDEDKKMVESYLGATIEVAKSMGIDLKEIVATEIANRKAQLLDRIMKTNVRIMEQEEIIKEYKDVLERIKQKKAKDLTEAEKSFVKANKDVTLGEKMLNNAIKKHDNGEADR